ncbi:hypothetical protein RRG08_050509 [Elysia crispata]|uniref:Uncharacterized protein n=1 Tax=Elysia crispata TaxID=231223 RepID=A0AAE1CL62_9GAST|nr:hypothetical protein RRG08_050509 [Elysia crispata]
MCLIQNYIRSLTELFGSPTLEHGVGMRTRALQGSPGSASSQLNPAYSSPRRSGICCVGDILNVAFMAAKAAFLRGKLCFSNPFEHYRGKN